MATGSKSARITPADGDAFFTSAITRTSPGRRSTAANPRAGGSSVSRHSSSASGTRPRAASTSRRLASTIRSRIVGIDAVAPGTLGGLAGDAILDPAPAPNTPEDAVPTDPIAQAGGLAVAAAEVAAVAVPVAVGCGLLARRLGRPVVPPWRPRLAVWTGFDILFLFFLHLALLSVAASVLSASAVLDAVSGPTVAADPAGAVGGAAAAAAVGERAADVRVLRGMWATVFATPALLLAGLAVRGVGHGRPVRFRPADLPADVAFGTLAWVVATPAVFAVHFTAVYITELSGG